MARIWVDDRVNLAAFSVLEIIIETRRSQMLRTPKELPKRLCCVVLLDKRERKGRNSDDREHWERWEQSGVVSFSKLKVIKLKWEWFCGGLFCVCMLWKDESERATIIQLNSGWVWGCVLLDFQIYLRTVDKRQKPRAFWSGEERKLLKYWMP